MIEVNPEERIPHHRNRGFPISLVIVLALGAGAYWYYTLQTERFTSVYTQLGIQPLPVTVAWQPNIQTRLDQLKREQCYQDAVVNLANDLLDAGYPREAAISLQTFANRCGGTREVLPLAYEALQRVKDFAGALDIAKQLVDAAPENGTFRYWRADAYDQTSDVTHALNDYMNSIQLVGNSRDVVGDAFYKLSRAYDKLDRPCDAITPIEMYISMDPANRRTPQASKIISDYAAKGNCDSHYANGTARVAFAADSGVRLLPSTINGVTGTFILDTGASFVSVTSQFAAKAKIGTDAGNQVTLQTASGRILADIGYANSVVVGKAEAKGVVVAVDRKAESPFGPRVDGLLGMSFLSRFNLELKPNGIELSAIPLK
jgi:clan AA aspartic protease (TIGR02281 family)